MDYKERYISHTDVTQLIVQDTVSHVGVGQRDK